MTIRTRLLLLLGSLLAVFAVATGGLLSFQRREGRSIKTSIHSQRIKLVSRLLALTGQPLANLARDYAQWDDMVAFLGNGNREWAKINLDASLDNFDAKAAWVLRLDGSQFYQCGSLDPAAAATLPFADAEFLAALARQRELHFFHESPAGLLEVRTGPILPSDDTHRTGAPRGWLVVAKLWNDDYLQVLSDTLQSKVAFSPATDLAQHPAAVQVEHELTDWRGRKIRTLYAAYQSPALTELLEGNDDEFVLLCSSGLVMIGVTTFGISRWVLSPMRKLSVSLERGEVAPLADLHGQSNEFGHLARLVEQSFGQRASLENEVRERSRMAEELQQASAQLGESVELRGRLARDLHDGVIQSIYAAGLGLEGARTALRSDPAAAEQRLQACQAALNDTIRDVRTFINALESEAVTPRPFRRTLGTLIATLRSIQPGDIAMTVDDNLARRFSPAQELHLLQILRESIGNALRHAGARTIRVSLHAGTEREAQLAVADDGRGFDVSRAADRGRGLTNLGIRAREMGGLLHIDSAPGKGTRITLQFDPTYPA